MFIASLVSYLPLTSLLEPQSYSLFSNTSHIYLHTSLHLLLLQTQVLSARQVNESCIGLTQENSIENSVQNSLPLYTKTSWSILTTSSLL